MLLKRLEIVGFKSFAKKSVFVFDASISAIVGPNGSGKSNVAEAIRFVLGEQSIKSMRGKRGEDMIFNGSQHVSKLNHAKVSIIFDNTGKDFNIDFEEVVIAREVYRDGTHEYSINGTQVRLKDIIELLASVHIGASGHHIISQGEADRVLSASPKERKIMIEDALGLKIYHYKLDESRKKLEKTEVNLHEAEVQRREIAPHLRYLKKQMERIEKAKELTEELSVKYREYLRRELFYVGITRDDLKHKRVELEGREKSVNNRVDELQSQLNSVHENAELKIKRQNLNVELQETRSHRTELSRSIGRTEGLIEMINRDIAKFSEKPKQSEFVSLARANIERTTQTLNHGFDTLEANPNEQTVREMVPPLRQVVSDLVGGEQEVVHNPNEDLIKEKEQELVTLKAALEDVRDKVQRADERDRQVTEQLREIDREDASSREGVRGIQNEFIQEKEKQNEIALGFSHLVQREEQLGHAEHEYNEELEDATRMLGKRIEGFESDNLNESEARKEERSVQLERRRDIDRSKVRLEDLGATSDGDVVREFDETRERDEYLLKEVEDLTQSARSIKDLISQTELELENKFTEGVKKINKQFETFFMQMFGGGMAKLEEVDLRVRGKGENGELLEIVGEGMRKDKGIDIDISLPKKKIKGLMMLSGGERALTSIALLFAMSQVNPPPFMVLDETDAALDEANSRRYGDMLEELSKLSQLVVITHNRETMARAGVLYGVTMSSDAVSTVLSVKLDEAVAVAK